MYCYKLLLNAWMIVYVLLLEADGINNHCVARNKNKRKVEVYIANRSLRNISKYTYICVTYKGLL